jgi:hypothetical protein
MVIATRRDDAGVTSIWLERRAGALWLGEDPAAAGAAPPPEIEVGANALFATFNRYGRALELGLVAPEPAPGDTVLEVTHGGVTARLHAFRFRGFGDVISSDYLALTPAGGEAMVVPAAMAASALTVVARAAARVGKVAPGGT